MRPDRRGRVYHFYPRPPDGGRQQFDYPVYIDLEISIHALRMEGDRKDDFQWQLSRKFLSTPSGWRATTFHLSIRRRVAISIHALRMEGDKCLHRVTLHLIISIHALRMEGD